MGLTQERAKRRALSRRFMTRADADEEAGTSAEDEALRRRQDFDAQGAAEESARAQFDMISEDLGRTLRDFRSSQVGSGRLNTGFRYEDEDELYEGALEDLGRTLSSNALQAEQLNLQNTAGLAREGGARSERSLDIMASERDASLTEEEIMRKDKEKKRKGLFGFLGRVGGTILGPAGSVVGEKIGTAVEGLLD